MREALQATSSVPQTPIDKPPAKSGPASSAASSLRPSLVDSGSQTGLSGFFARRRKSSASLLDAKSSSSPTSPGAGVSTGKLSTPPAKQHKSTLHELKRFLNHHIPHHSNDQTLPPQRINIDTGTSATQSPVSTAETTVHTPEDPHETQRIRHGVSISRPSQRRDLVQTPLRSLRPQQRSRWS